MREIKFRAISLAGGIWVYGYHYEECGNTYIIEDRQKHNGDLCRRNTAYPVNPDTVCEWTGLTDSKGRDIYEHDIIEIPNERGELVLGEVKWIGSGFEVGIDDNFFIGAPLYAFAPEVRARVVGNIYDNPDLLKCTKG